MSGFEVVGVVLGALPMIIGAIDKYKATSQRFRFFRFKEPFIAQLIQSLQEQRFFLETDLQVILKETHLEDEEIAVLLKQSNSSLFEDPEVAHAVQEYLGDGYEPYTIAVTRCQEVLTEIAGHIRGLASDSQINLATLVQTHSLRKRSHEITKKIKFSLEKQDLENRINDLKDATQTLCRVRDSSVLRTEVTVQSTSRTVAKFTSTMNAVREYAHCLYSAISLGYGVGCHQEHKARLFLESRARLMEKKTQRSLKRSPVDFNVALEPSDNPVLCYKTDIKVMEEEVAYSCLGAPPTDISTPQVTISLPNQPEPAHPPPSRVHDLCQSISQAQNNGESLGLYLARPGCLYHRHMPSETKVAAMSKEFFSLDQILDAQSKPKPDFPPWTLNQRMALSFRIASSVMQLLSTPWLYLPLTSSSICFSQNDQLARTSATQPFADMPQPFITHRFSCQMVNSGCGCNSKRSLLELGIILLELWHGRTLSSYAAEVQMPVDNSFGGRYNAARRWLDISAYYVLPFYLEIVTRCVECTFATSSSTPDWNDLVFRKSVCEYVLKPLWDNCPIKLR
ncbi:hypothetical protein P168DRAFT_299736 [Aspergillus campestris IBT 28561]|uniref:DUF7580 domain-containing protein n=1 Tax=Aspergillus campestris (strain IBT 28561) TaxID=1392248 RepID=A0A2I1CTB7_ASPC2|nr:uncharacterized protein P168DRAFT_299736 [Aspergillus campestris IBT 28561]PKY00855.1 hypothetical protein P168DRAFT_299736 [Aspergillus campestris IBT 28561]